MIKIATLDETWNGDDVEKEVTRLMAALHELDVSNGIGILVDLSRNGVVLVLACMRLGLRTAICPLREPREIIEAWLVSLDIKTLVSSLRDDNSWPKIKVADLLNQQKSFCAVDRTSTFTSLMRTSGTTAQPKTAIISARAHMASARSVCEYFSFDEASSWALSLPLFHVSGFSIIARAVHARGAIFLAPTQTATLAALDQKAITHISLVPTQLARMASAIDCAGVKAVALGGDALPPSLREHARAHRLPVYETYGLTETASMIYAYDLCRDRGEILSHATIKIADDKEILVGGKSLFEGYWSSPNVIVDGFFKTGDLGFIDDDHLVINGRKHHRIISGGENIQAEEIERVIELHPHVESCAVVGMPDNEFGMRPLAIIKWREHSISDRAMIDHIKVHVASYKIPKAIITWPSHAPATLKKPRLWLAQWAMSVGVADKSVIVCA